ncbi:hypothetical protein [Oscillatoria sp. FACHB-1406]|nr:hypothetical protein [Oscillatoria sp. FACHB-1406]
MASNRLKSRSKRRIVLSLLAIVTATAALAESNDNRETRNKRKTDPQKNG